MPTTESLMQDLEAAAKTQLEEIMLLGSPEESAAARAVSDSRTLADLKTAIGEFDADSAKVVDLIFALQPVIDEAKKNPVNNVLDRLETLTDKASQVLEVVHGALGTEAAEDEAAEVAEPVPPIPEPTDEPEPTSPPADPIPIPDPPSPQPGPAIIKSKKYADLKDEYAQYFATCAGRGDKSASVDAFVAKMLAGRDQYRAVADPLGIPWYFVAAIHGLEGGFNFKTHLHNGDPLTARTRRVPEGRPETGEPPFSWTQSATDALTMKGYADVANWSLPAILYRWERYNGLGYRNRGLPTPYLWSFSNHYVKGKYVADGKFDPNAVSKQCGGATALRLMVNRGEVVLS